MGTANHAAAEFNFTQKIQTGTDLPVKEVVEFYQDKAVPEAVENNGGKDEIEAYDENKLRLTGSRMVELYRTEVSPRVHPIGVEEWCEVQLPGVPVPVVGKIDVVENDNTVDLKTSARKKTSVAEGWVIQGRIYQLFKPVGVEWHVVTSASTPQVFTPLEEPGLWQSFNGQNTETTIHLIRTIAQQIEHLYSTIGPDETWPLTGIINRSCGWCGFTTCPARSWA